MRLIFFVVVVVGVALGTFWRYRRNRRWDPVSPQWLVENRYERTGDDRQSK